MTPRPPDSPAPFRALPLMGAQVSTSGGLLRSVERALAIGAEVVQIFPTNPRRWGPAPLADVEVMAFRQALDAAGLPLFVHTIYLINLASPDPELHGRGAAALADALYFGSLAGAQGVVTHIGSHRGGGFDAAVPRVREGVAAAQTAAIERLERVDPSALPPLERAPQWLPPLLLETSAGSGDSLGRDPFELCLLLDRLNDAPGPCGLCLDTAHLFAAGFPVHTRPGLDDLLGEFQACGRLADVALVHLNDCKSALGSKADRHENIGDGLLGADGLAVSVQHPDLAGVPFVLEVPGLDGAGPDRTNMERAKALRPAASRAPREPAPRSPAGPGSPTGTG